MCGILGIILKNENENISNFMLDGLIQLQNRGYDSSGLCILNNNNFNNIKYASNDEYSALQKIKNKICDKNLFSSIAIGHNRWATHGEKTDYNAHPHISYCGNWCLVHNGIIENYLSIKQILLEKNFKFNSDTDTEVIVNLISYNYEIYKCSITAIENTLNQLFGTYALLILNRNENKIYFGKNGSPLLMGLGKDEIILTSEESGFCGKIKNYICLENKDIGYVYYENDSLIFKMTSEKEYERIDVSVVKYDLTPYPYKHWTIKEILEQPNVINNSLNNGGRIKNNDEIKLGGIEKCENIFKDINNIIFLGCGTSYHVCVIGTYFCKLLCNFNIVQYYDGADFTENDIPKNGKTVFVLISQSGETRDLYLSLEIAKKYNIPTIGIINVVGSLISREVTCGIYCNAGREIGVASTKSFTAQVICTILLILWFSQIQNINYELRKEFIDNLKNLQNDFHDTIEDIKENIEDISKKWKDYKNMFILGKGVDEWIAKEGALKIKELSYIHSEGYSASSLKHGSFALLDENFPTIIINCDNNYDSKIINCLEEVRTRKSPVILITNNKKIHIKEDKDVKIIYIKYNKSFSSLLGIIPLQLLSYYISINKNINPDIPRNLAKVVTVE